MACERLRAAASGLLRLVFAKAYSVTDEPGKPVCRPKGHPHPIRTANPEAAILTFLSREHPPAFKDREGSDYSNGILCDGMGEVKRKNPRSRQNPGLNSMDRQPLKTAPLIQGQTAQANNDPGEWLVFLLSSKCSVGRERFFPLQKNIAEPGNAYNTTGVGLSAPCNARLRRRFFRGQTPTGQRPSLRI